MTECNYRRWVIAAWSITAAPIAWSLISYASGSEKAPFLASATPGTQCLLDRNMMRKHHMVYLKQQRDRVVREGSRPAHGPWRIMETCGNCHASKTEFCDKCHSRAGVNLDCFGCHQYRSSGLLSR